MLKIEPTPPKSSHFSLFPALFNHLVTHRWLNLYSKGPSPTFSATLRWPGRAAQLGHYCSQTSPDLLGTKRSVPTFPRSQYPKPQTLRHYQLVVNHTDHLRPQLELARFSQAGLAPQQILFVEPVAMFYRETPLVSGPNLTEFKFTLTRPYKPAFNWVAPFATGPQTTYPDYAQGQLGCLAQVQALPFAHHQFGTSFIYSLPLPISLAVSSFSVTLKAGAVFGRRSSSVLSNCHHSLSVKDPISFEAHQQVVIGANCYQKSFGWIVPVAQIYRLLGKVSSQLFELIAATWVGVWLVGMRRLLTI